MDHGTLHITVVHGLIMSKITSDAHPMAFLEIYPVRRKVDTGNRPRVARLHEVTTCYGQVSELATARLDTHIKPEHLPASADIKSVYKSVYRLRIKRTDLCKDSRQVESRLEEESFFICIFHICSCLEKP